MQDFRISWGDDTLHPYSIGVDRGMLYIPGTAGVPWNGLQSVVESPPESILSQTFIDGQKITIHNRAIDYKGTLKAFMYPPEFEPYSGYNPSLLKPFGLSYRTWTGPDAYQIHLLYNIVATPDDVVFSTLGEEIDPTIFSWSLSTRPVKIAGRQPSAHLILDSSTVHPWTFAIMEDQLYGGEGVIPHLPMPEEVEQIFEENAILRVFDNGDGTVTITGPEEAITLLPLNQVTVSWPSVIKQPSGFEYQVSSL